ncbi:MAG: late competence development ComFB family protein, partial [Thermostichales cyanobacterium GMQP_bins_62]
YPRYATSFEGAIYTLDNLQQDQELQVQIIREVAAAMEIVAAKPHCQEPDCPIKKRQALLDS